MKIKELAARHSKDYTTCDNEQIIELVRLMRKEYTGGQAQFDELLRQLEDMRIRWWKTQLNSNLPSLRQMAALVLEQGSG